MSTLSKDLEFGSGNNSEGYETPSESDDDAQSDDDNDPQSNEEVIPVPDEIIYPGLVLKYNYILLKKIGYGNNAVVWMTYMISTKEYRAIKIQDHQCYHDGCREVVIVKKINGLCRSQNKDIYCVNMLDYFVYEEDEETKYVCSVYDLYAGSIQMVLDQGKYKYGLPIPVVKTITKQLLTALSTLHDELHIIHTDIKTENILLKGTPIDHLAIMELFEKTDFPTKYQRIKRDYANDDTRFMEELESLALDCVKEINSLIIEIENDEDLIPDDDDDDYDDDDLIEGEDDSNGSDDNDDSDSDESDICAFNKRKQSVDDIIEHLDYTEIHDLETEAKYDFSRILNNRPNTTDGKEIIDDSYIMNCVTALTDFGNSYFYEKRTKNEIQDRRYRAPEVVLDHNYNYACDMWSVVCVVFELLTGFVLFEPAEEPLNKDIHHLFLMEKNLGSMPLKMKKGSRRCRFLFDENRNYHIKNVAEFQLCSLRRRLVEQFLFSEQDAEEIYGFLMCGLKYDPAERLSAKELLNHPWLKCENVSQVDEKLPTTVTQAQHIVVESILHEV